MKSELPNCTKCVHGGREACIIGKTPESCKRFDSAAKKYHEMGRPFDCIFVRTVGTYSNLEICDWCGKKRYGHQIVKPDLSEIWDICNGCLAENFEEVKE